MRPYISTPADAQHAISLCVCRGLDAGGPVLLRKRKRGAAAALLQPESAASALSAGVAADNHVGK
jgi:hypothetical protein